MILFAAKRTNRTAIVDQRFEDLTRSMSESLPRRSACKLLGGGVLGAALVGLGLGGVAAACKSGGKPCRRNSECCSKRCVKKKCRAVPPSNRKLSVSASMDITDDDLFSDDHCQYDQSQDFVLTPTSPQATFQMDRGCGGEVRIELDLDIQKLSNGDATISGTLLLFEGTSENTTDLDGQTTIGAFTVPSGTTVTKQFTVASTEATADDHAKITAVFTNSVI
jgi:hypothetical protein